MLQLSKATILLCMYMDLKSLDIFVRYTCAKNCYVSHRDVKQRFDNNVNCRNTLRLIERLSFDLKTKIAGITERELSFWSFDWFCKHCHQPYWVLKQAYLRSCFILIYRANKILYTANNVAF